MSVFNGRASDIEDNRNKVSTINENSTDAQYPSAKAVYDAMQSVTVDYSLVANALKGTASGKVVAIKDVSLLPHDVTVKVSGGDTEGGEVLTKTETLSTKDAAVLLDNPASSVRVVVSGGAYCVGGLVPMVDGDNLTASESKDELALWPTWSYGEAPGNYDLVYTISGNTLSWSGTKYYEFDGVIEQSKDISGSVELNTSGQKIIGFCQIYDLDEDNPFAESPEWDELHMTVAVYESTPSVEVKVYGKNFITDKKEYVPSVKAIYFGTTNYYVDFITLEKGTYTFSIVCADGGTATLQVMNAKFGNITQVPNVKSVTFTIAEQTKLIFKATANRFTSIDDIVSAQVESGTGATAHEKYIEPKTYTVTANGTAIVSIYPSMTFVPEKDGVELSVEYNRDINKAFAQLQAALISMGGNI